MKKIESRQMPRATIARPLLMAGALVISLAAGGDAAQAQGCVVAPKPPQPQQKSRPLSRSESLNIGISGRTGCVIGAEKYGKTPSKGGKSKGGGGGASW